MRGWRRRALVLATGATLTAGGLAAPAAAAPQTTAPPASTAPYCGIWWGSLPEAQPGTRSQAVVTDVRAGRHECFDRLVVDLRGPADGAPRYDVRYVDAVSAQGSGDPVPLRGGAALQVIVGAPAHEEWQPTYLPDDPAEVVDVTGFATLEQVAWAGSFEGQTSLGLGTRGRLPFRVFTLLGEPGTDRAVRLVVDVAHRW